MNDEQTRQMAEAVEVLKARLTDSDLAHLIANPEGFARARGVWPEFEPFSADDADWIEFVGRVLLAGRRSTAFKLPA